MPIKFSIAKRGLLPHEEERQQGAETTDVKNLRPQLECPATVDAVEFQSGSLRLPSVMPKGELMAALGTMQNVMLHELEKGNAVFLPGIGTFRLTLRGNIGVKGGSYHGQDVRVDGIRFRPDRGLLEKARRFKVDQVPLGQAVEAGESSIETCFSELFARQSTVTHKDVSARFGQTLTRGRVSAILRHLVREGRIIREGKGAQTRYRAAEGQF